MAIKISDNGSANSLDVSESAFDRLSGSIAFDGDDNSLKIGTDCLSGTLNFVIRNGCNIKIGHHGRLGHLQIYADHGAVLEIGDHVGFNGHVRLQLHEAASIKIGSGSLFGGDVEVTISDMHSIIDLETGGRINPARDVVIGDRVWIGARTMILKGAIVGSGAVIGAGSIVTKAIPANCVAAGNPARVIRSNASWRFELI